MSIGHFDSLDSAGILSGWFVTPESDPTNSAGDVFAVLQGDTVIAVGRQTIARPDVEARYGVSKAGFEVRLLPIRPLLPNVPFSLTLPTSNNAAKTNQFFPSEEILSSNLNSVEATLKNAALIASTTDTWLFSRAYLSAFGLQDYSRAFASTYYYCMKECWSAAPNEWIDVEHITLSGIDKGSTSLPPLEVLHQASSPPQPPNCVFDVDYIAARLPPVERGEHLSAAAVLRRWIDLADRGMVIRPSPIIRGRFDETGKFSGTAKGRNEFLGQLLALVDGSADFATLAKLVPVYDVDWLRTRPIKASENGASVLKAALNDEVAVPPNPYLRDDGLATYRHCCERRDSGETVSLSEINTALSTQVTPMNRRGETLDVDLFAQQLRRIATWKPVSFNPAFVEKLFPGVFSFLEKRTGLKDAALLFKLYLEQLDIPGSLDSVDLSKLQPGFSALKLSRLGHIPPRSQIRTSIVIPTLGRLDLVFKLLLSLANSSTSETLEVIVSDDGSNVDVSILGFFFPNVKFLSSAENKGFLRNVNAAAKSAQGEYLLLANNDLVVHKRAIDQLVEIFDEYPDAGAVGGLVLSQDGSVQECGGAIWADASAWNLFRGESEHGGMPKNVRDVDYVSGCWLATRKSIWIDVGGLSDELAPAYYDDMDYCLKVRARGHRILVNPHSRVTHLEGQTMGIDTSSKKDGKRFQQINQRKVLAKWQTVIPSMYSRNGHLSMQFRGYKHLKPIALIYDHYCPEPDRDAGSKTVFEFISAICKSQDYYPIFVPMNNRYSKYATQLERMGVEVIHGTGWARLERLLSDFGSQVALTLCSRLEVAKHFDWHIGRSGGQKLIYIQDVAEMRHATAFALPDDGDATHIYQRHVNAWKITYDRFDHVLTCSASETEHLATLLPQPVSTISPYRSAEMTIPDRSSKKCEMLFVGSVNHYPNLAGIEWFATSVFPAVRARISDATLHIVGSGFEDCTWLESPGIILHGQVSAATLEFLYSVCNLAIAPLLEGAGTKGKVVEALSYGKPCIGTPIAFQGLSDVLSLLPPKVGGAMAGTVDSLASRIIKYCHASPATAKSLRDSVGMSIGKADPGSTLMEIVAGRAI